MQATHEKILAVHNALGRFSPFKLHLDQNPNVQFVGFELEYLKDRSMEVVIYYIDNPDLGRSRTSWVVDLKRSVRLDTVYTILIKMLFDKEVDFSQIEQDWEYLSTYVEPATTN